MIEATEETNPNLFVYCCDFSPNAVNLVKENEKFNANRCLPFVWDITRSDVEIPVQAGSLDYILCVFVLSALPPEKQTNAIENLVRLLKKGGILYVRDYGRHGMNLINYSTVYIQLLDLTQLRFKKEKYIDENFYCRGDGTFTHFFDGADLDKMFTDAGLSKIENFCDKRMVVNRKEKKTMFR